MVKKAFSSFEWSNCVLNSQMCIELSLKSLLEALEIEYEIKGGKGHRDYLSMQKLSENIVAICEKLNINYDFEKVRIAKAFVRGLLWQGIRNVAQGFGPKGVAVKDLFEKEEAELAKLHAWDTYNLCSRHIYKLK